jgi:hypothetical protein
MTAPSSYQYRVGGHLPVDSPSYVVRAADRQLYQGLIAGDICYVLNSRQMGKTSLRFRTMNLLQAADIACVAIDLQAIGSRNITVQQWYAGLVKRLVQGFRLSDRFDFRAWWQAQDLLSPVQRWCEFVEVQLPQLIERPIVIFIDEIDSTLSLEFDTDDFFASIRACNEKDHLTFALFGVATPADLIKDSKRSPFNVGRGIELRGFQLGEAVTLIAGLQDRAARPDRVLQAILNWTGGQPFLTQKLCMFVQGLPTPILASDEEKDIEDLVRSKIISDWETQDEPKHLKTIQNRLLRSDLPNAHQLLALYQKVLTDGNLLVDENPAQLELRLSGVVVKEHDRLQIHNPIYAQVFDRHWLARVLAERRPYRESFNAWLATERQDESRLLRGKALQEANAWSKGKQLNDLDRDFLAASQRLENKLQKDRKVRKLLLGTTILVSVLAFCSTFFFLAAADNAHRDRVRALVNSSKAHRQAGENRESLLDGISAVQLSQQIRGSKEKLAALENLRDLLRKLKADRGVKSPEQDWTFRFKDVVFSADSQKVWAVDADGQISTWQTDGTSLQNVKILSERRLLSLDFSPNGNNVVTTNGNKTISIWRSQDGQLVKTFDGDGQRWQHVSYSPNGQTIAASSLGDIKLWGLDGKLLSQLSGHQDPITGLSFSPNGQLLASSSRDSTVRLWNLAGRNLKTWRGHAGVVTTIAFGPNNRLVASGGGDRTIKLWDVEGKLLRSIDAHQQRITVLAFHPDGTMVASASNDRTIKLWRLDGTLVKTLMGHRDVINKAIFSPDGQKLVSASVDGALQLWDLKEDAPRTIQQAPPLASAFRVESPETSGSKESQREAELSRRESNNETGQIPKAIEAGCQELSEYQSNNDLSSEGERVCEGITGNKKNQR